jgi:hypothetical protein
LAERYGAAPRTRRPLLLAGLAVLVVVALTWLGWVALAHARPEVSSQLVGFSVADEHAASARFTVVRREAGVTAHCVLRAYAEDHAVVGEVTVDVGPDRPRTTTLEADLRTERRATTVELRGCTSAGQQRAR